MVSAIALVSSLCLSCWQPPFDAELSMSAAFAKQLEAVASFQAGSYQSYELEGGYFVPDRALEPTGGYWVAAGHSSVTARYVDFSAGDYGTSYSVCSFGSSALGPLASISSMTPASMASLSPTYGSGLLLALSASASGGVIAYGLDDAHYLSGALYGSISGPSNPILLGAYRAPHSTTADSLALLCWDASVGGLYAGALTIDNAIALSASTLALSTPASYSALGLESGCFFGLSPLGFYYLSGVRSADGELVSISFAGLDDAAPNVLSGVGRQLTGILSDGRLLARGDATTIVYDDKGSQLCEIKTAGLRFVHEVYDGVAGAWYSYFSWSYPLVEDGDDSYGQLCVRIYRIVTAKLESLE